MPKQSKPQRKPRGIYFPPISKEEEERQRRLHEYQVARLKVRDILRYGD